MMLVVMIVILSQGINGQSIAWFPLSLMGTCCCGTVFGVLVTLLPLPRFAFAMRAVDETLLQMQLDTDMLFRGIHSIALAPRTANLRRQAISQGDLAIKRLARFSTKMSILVAPVEIERMLFHPNFRRGSVKRLSSFITQQQRSLNIIGAALMQKIIGKDNSSPCEPIPEAIEFLGAGVHDAVAKFDDSVIAVMDFYRRWLNQQRSPEIADDEIERQLLHRNLINALDDYQHSWDTALPKVEAIMFPAEDESVQPAAFLLRRMEISYGMRKYGTDLASFLESMGEVIEQRSGAEFYCATLTSYLAQPWMRKGFQLPLKAAVGMTIASFWISVPFFHGLSDPFSVWPGITVVSLIRRVRT